MPQPVDQFDYQKQGPGDDQKIDADGNKAAPGEDCALLLGFGQRVGGHRRRETDEMVGKVEPARDGADRRHENVAHQRLDDLAECSADDDADGQVDHVAFEGEFLEFLEHRFLLRRCRASSGRSAVRKNRIRYWHPGQLGRPRKGGAGAVMLQGWVVIVVALGYIGLLFVVASYGDRMRLRERAKSWQLVIYPLSLAIYCTSWTFFGSVGFASRTGFDFLTIYFGPILMIGLCWPLIVRIVRLAKAQNITSIADFIAARYGKGQAVAATVALIAIIGTIPYIALQLKAVSASLGTILAHISDAPGGVQPVLGDIALFVAFAMAIFAVLFGTRHVDATEHQDGLMLAIATESIVKLVAFLAVGVFATFVMFDGPFHLFSRAMEQPKVAAVLTGEPQVGILFAMTLLSLL